MKAHKTPKRITAIILIIVTQLACQTAYSLIATETPIPTATVVPSVTPTQVAATSTPDPAQPVPLMDEEIKLGIQQSLDIYAEALTTNQPELLEQVVDQENKPFRRIVRSRFDDHQGSFIGGQIDFEFVVTEITRRDHGYVMARFDFNNGLEAHWPFRYVNGTWVISEPTVEQIGEPATTETENFVFTSYPWADDVNSTIMDLMENARENVSDVLGQVPAEKANVEILPIYGLYPFDSMGAIASYSRGPAAADDRIAIYTPNSYSYGVYDPSFGWDAELEVTLTHEYTHMTHARSFGGAGRLSDWMSEGLAEYVAGQAEYNSYMACRATKSGTFIPILDEAKNIYKQDLMHMYGLTENFALSYDFAGSLVAFTVERYGGLDGFWELANSLDETSDFRKAVQGSFGIPYEEYDKQWQAWLKKQC